MRTLILSNTSNTFLIRMKVDMSSNSNFNFSVLSIEGADTTGELLTGIQTIFKTGLNYTMTQLRNYATANNLTLSMVANTANAGSTTIILSQATALNITTTSPMAAGTNGQAYSQSVVGAGGKTPYTFAVATGTLPTGTTLNASTGLVSGTLGATGTFNFTIRITDLFGDTFTKALQIVVS